jgi:uncharacterized OB-fold protein
MSQSPPAPAYLERLAAGALPYQRCAACQAAFSYPRLLCPACGGADVPWYDSAGLGTVYSRTVVHSRDEAPFNVVLVDLDEGFRVMSSVEDADNGDVAIGLRVALKTVHELDGDGLPRPVFRPAEEG